MSSRSKLYLTAKELAGLIGISEGYAYRIIRQLNQELKENGFLIVAGKLPRKYFEKRWYGFEQEGDQ